MWTDGQNVRGCATGSCGSPTTITSGRQSVYEITNGGGRVFWSECVADDADASAGGGLFGCPVTGCVGPVEPLWADKRCVVAAAYDAVRDLLYFSVGELVYRCSPSNCSASALVLADKQTGYVNSISLVDDRVYWIESILGLPMRARAEAYSLARPADASPGRSRSGRRSAAPSRKRTTWSTTSSTSASTTSCTAARRRTARRPWSPSPASSSGI